ncbi:3-hydroxyisobutyrate dehydrogenase [Aquabacterium sp.]|uniref:3-hydroxyisobutyrate dehydrogenase n=1 Tax=Aquabacterium sp. TaxID=1872578 RepID=UPI002BDA498F|nr:3-hydroxyisobutyrate dehydrogenase [Aquabacterium sp.]HSW03903.1 3-hydroxyisobutyrate dehydrogenase [Aquabacterium sp.]
MSDPHTTPVAFIGLGNMGLPMALNLMKAGHPVRGFDLSETARALAATQGLPLAGSAHEAVEGAAVVISMLPASRHVEALYLGPAGLLGRLPAGTLLIDCSTIAPASSRLLAEAAVAQGLDCLDAPVSGGTAGAAAGTLTFMAGGDAATLDQATPLLQRMGANVFHCGGAGAGQATKLCNNMLLAVLMIGTSEALALGQSLGLDATVLSEVMRRSSGGNWVLEKYNPVPGVMDAAPASRGYSGGFGSALMLKDLGLAMEAAVASGSATPLGAAARQLYAMHCQAGQGGLDFSSVLGLISGQD